MFGSSRGPRAARNPLDRRFGPLVDVSGDVVEDPSFKVGGFRERIGSVDEGDEHLSPMAEDDLQVGMAVEGSGEDQPQRGRLPRHQAREPA